MELKSPFDACVSLFTARDSRVQRRLLQVLMNATRQRRDEPVELTPPFGVLAEKIVGRGGWSRNHSKRSFAGPSSPLGYCATWLLRHYSDRQTCVEPYRPRVLQIR